MSRPPRIVLATRVFTPEAVAAAFREEALVRALEESGAEVTVLTTRPPRGVTGRDRVRHVSRFPVKRDHQQQVRGYLCYMSFDVPLALRLLLRRRPDVIIAEPPPTTGLVATVLGVLRRVPTVFYAADVWSDATESVEGVPAPIRAAVRLMETTSWKRAAKVLTISPGVDDRVAALIGPRPSLTMVGNGIDTDTFTPEGPQPVEETSQGPYFVYGGTVSEWQGADVFVEAFARVRAERPDARLLFFSEGSGKEALARKVAEEGIEGVEFRGRLAPADMSRVLRGAVAGLSSITPGLGYEFALPTKIYAATASGTPVIHAGEGAAFERVRDADLGWASAYDPAAVAASMLAALAGEERPTSEHLRSWTLENASLQGAAERAAEAVLEAAR
ncbi:glycosyltransferase family 4 protein [Brachybacterium sp. MASK1Z-5]|uniref:D-inositol 3-phosphate glycosyltransferase n=1 Tax=Brachybacterium halotolerans TaxID=2795215 RepID=A0ABS1BC14_9MICO|nr:glycosyltransferase family 4 protein [Brachybacterium halotolerans]MBK0332163.1 glycosyltransferase family 4 protein [Brachybacterium halotolerans]